MKYLMLICSDGIPTVEKAETMRNQMPGWVQEMDGRGVRLMGHALAEPATAVTVRTRDGETLVTDGPFVEAKEFIGGFDVIECANLDEAIEVAAAHPVSWFHTIEIRPFLERPLGPGTPDDYAPPALPSDAQLTTVAPGRERYVLFMCLNGIPEPDEEEQAIIRDGVAWAEDLSRRGALIAGHGLQNQDMATTVQVRGGETIVTDGPFAETKEFLGGFAVLDVADRTEAVELAARHPLARYHRIEVRPLATDPLGDEADV